MDICQGVANTKTMWTFLAGLFFMIVQATLSTKIFASAFVLPETPSRGVSTTRYHYFYISSQQRGSSSSVVAATIKRKRKISQLKLSNKNGNLQSYNADNDESSSRSSTNMISSYFDPILINHETSQQPQRNLSNINNNNDERIKRSQYTVFIVDDEASIRTAVGDYLHQTSGFQIQTFDDGQSVLQYLIQLAEQQQQDDENKNNIDDNGLERKTKKKNAVLPNAIVSDILMPQMDGLTLLTTLRSHPQLTSIPVVLLTAKGQYTQDRIDGYDAGADCYLTKPFDPDELVAILDSLIVRHETLSGGVGGGISSGFVNDNDVVVDIIDGDDGMMVVNTKKMQEPVGLDDLKQDLKEIKDLLLTQQLQSQQQQQQTSNNENNTDNDVIMTIQELNVLELLCQGQTNKEIAQELKYSVRWVEGHLTNMYRKTNCQNRTELVRWAVATGSVTI